MLRNAKKWWCRHWRSILIFAVILGVLMWVVGGSSSFQSCTSHDDYQSSYEASKQGFAKFLRLIEIRWYCIGAFIDVNNGAISVVATIAIAAFTFTLWRSTNRLSQVGEAQAKATADLVEVGQKQVALAGRQADFADKLATIERRQHLAAYRPNIVIHTCEKFIVQPNVVGAKFRVVNAGVNRATITQITIKIGLGIDEIHARSIDEGEVLSLEQKINGGESFDCYVRPPHENVDAIAVWIITPSSSRKLWLIGNISYSDDLLCIHETGFCRYYDRAVGIWQRAENSDYNYSY